MHIPMIEAAICNITESPESIEIIETFCGGNISKGEKELPKKEILEKETKRDSKETRKS